MPDFRYVLCDVFTDRPLAGNQLAVFTDARAIAGATIPLLARELNLSETVFVCPSGQGGHARIRIFTPASELPFAGDGVEIASPRLRRRDGRTFLRDFHLAALHYLATIRSGRGR